MMRCLTAIAILAVTGTAAATRASAQGADTWTVVAPHVVVVRQVVGDRVTVGTGWIARDGSVITAAHVIQQSSFPVQVASGQGQLRNMQFTTARVAGINRDADVARVTTGSARVGLPLVEIPVQSGEEVWVFGYEFGPGASFAVLRMARASIGQRFRDYFQLDGAVQPGFSGGPVTTRGGRVAGMVSFQLGSNPNLAYIVPAHVISGLFPSTLQEQIRREPPQDSRPVTAAPSEGYHLLTDSLRQLNPPSTGWAALRLVLYSTMLDTVRTAATHLQVGYAAIVAGCAPELSSIPSSSPLAVARPVWAPAGTGSILWYAISDIVLQCPGGGEGRLPASLQALIAETLDIHKAAGAEAAAAMLQYRMAVVHDTLLALHDLSPQATPELARFAACTRSRPELDSRAIAARLLQMAQQQPQYLPFPYPLAAWHAIMRTCP